MQSDGADESVPDHGPRPGETQQEAQVRLVLERLGDVVEPGPENYPDVGIKYFVRRDFVMVRQEYAGDIREFLGAAGHLPADGEDGPAEWDAESAAPADVGESDDEDDDPEYEEEPFPVLGVPPADGEIRHGLQWIRLRRGVGTLRALRDIRDGITDVGGGFGDDKAYAEKFFHVSPDTGTCCPADEPDPVAPGSSPDPPLVADRSAGAGVRVVVIDTGWYRRAGDLPWLRGVRGNRDPGIRGGWIDHYAGHGTFVAGVVRSMAPSAEVIVRAGFPMLGMVSELDLVIALDWVLLHDAPDIINISGGTWADADGPVLLNAFYERRLRHHKGVALVVAAGNDGNRWHFWPAAAPWTISVGALAANWRERAPFSNFGGWVDVFAPGEHLVNAFPRGTYRYNEPTRAGKVVRFHGMASWSGTSFSSPMVAGLIAARMSRTGENGVDAGAALLRTASRHALRGVGPVLLPTTDVRGKRR